MISPIHPQACIGTMNSETPIVEFDGWGHCSD
jgi:hypothetical protein